MYLAISGLYEQNKYYHDLLRTATTYICLSGMNAKPALENLRRGWPVERKVTGKISERALQQLKLLKQLDKDAGRSEVNSKR